MKTYTITKAKVKAKLIAQGNNPQDVEKMVEKHYQYAVENYSSMRTICECIRIID